MKVLVADVDHDGAGFSHTLPGELVRPGWICDRDAEGDRAAAAAGH